MYDLLVVGVLFIVLGLMFISVGVYLKGKEETPWMLTMFVALILLVMGVYTFALI